MKKIIYALTALAAIMSCTDINVETVETQENGKQEIVAPVITGTFSPETKAAFGTLKDGKMPLVWQVGDVIKVCNKTGNNTTNNNVKYTVESIAADGTATFKLAEGSDISVFDPDHDVYTAHMGMTSSTKSGICTNLDQMRSQVSSTDGKFSPGVFNDYICLAAQTTLKDGKLNFTFYPTTAIISFTIPERTTPIKKIRCQSENNLSGFIGIGFNDGIPFQKAIASGNTANAITSASGDSFLPGTYYIPLIDGTKSTFKLGYNTDGGKNFTYSATQTLTLTMGQITYLGTLPTD